MPPQNPDWPCAQRLVNTLESGSYWNGVVPTHTAWRDNEALFNLVTVIVNRDTPDAVAIAKLTAYAHKIPKSARARQYPLIFSAIIDQTNDDRDILIQRIEQLGHRQNELGATIAGLSTKLDSMPESAPTRPDTLGTRDLDIRVFKETQQTMRYACDAPANMERRLGLFASTLQKEMK